MLAKKSFWGLTFVNETKVNWEKWLAEFLAAPSTDCQLVLTPNPEQLMRARRQSKFYQTLAQADLLIPDGIGLVRAGKFKTRLTGVATAAYLLTLASKHKYKVLLIGGRYTQLAQTNTTGYLVLTLSPKVGIQTQLFYTQGYQNITQPTQKEKKAVEKLINTLKPELIMAALGAPYQELWLLEHAQFLTQNGVRLGLAVGGSFDFLLGILPRAPRQWRALGLEWLWRLKHEPRRWRRQLALPQFWLLNFFGQFRHPPNT